MIERSEARRSLEAAIDACEVALVVWGAALERYQRLPELPTSDRGRAWAQAEAAAVQARRAAQWLKAETARFNVDDRRLTSRH